MSELDLSLDDFLILNCECNILLSGLSFLSCDSSTFDLQLYSRID